MELKYEFSPISGRDTVASEYDSSVNQVMKLCMETGYHTFDSWKVGSDEVLRMLENSADHIRWTQFIDGDQVWTKIIIQTPEVVIYPDEGIHGFYHWNVNSFRFLEENEELNDEFPNYEVDGKTKVLDDTNLTVFGENEFEAAFIEFHRRVSEFRNAS